MRGFPLPTVLEFYRLLISKQPNNFMAKHFIYKIDGPTGKSYVGRTVNFEKRMYTHRSSAKRGKLGPLYAGIRKHGWDAFTKQIIAEVEGEQAAYALELIYINQYNTINEGYNQSTHTEGGGDNWEGRRDTIEYVNHCEHMRQLNLNGQNPTRGKRHTEEAKAKQKLAAKGRFSLPWFIDRHGEQEGQAKYDQRNQALRARKLAKGSGGRFAKVVPTY